MTLVEKRHQLQIFLIRKHDLINDIRENGGQGNIFQEHHCGSLSHIDTSQLMDHAKRGAAALEAKDPKAAIKAYTQALVEHPHSPDYFASRSAAFCRLSPARYDLALHDAELSVLLGQKRAKREKIQAGQHRRVVALYGLKRYADAKFILQTMEKWRPKEPENKRDISTQMQAKSSANMEGYMWNAKVDGKLKSLPESEQIAQVKEYPEVDLPSETAMRALLHRELQDRPWESEADKAATSANPNAEASTTVAPVSTGGDLKLKDASTSSTSNTALESSTALPKIRHEWYQNPRSVIVTIYAKGVSKDKVEAELQNDSVSLNFPHPSNPTSTVSFAFSPLFALIDAASSNCAIKSTKIELTLTKAVPGLNWKAIEGTEPLDSSDVSSLPSTTIPTSKPPIVDQPPSYPTSSKSGPKNWDKLASEFAKKPKGKAKPAKGDVGGEQAPGSDDDDEADADNDMTINSDDEYGGDGVDHFFKKLYAGADPDTQRAMMKSFQESNGTALSTNWSEVGKGKVEEVKSKDE